MKPVVSHPLPISNLLTKVRTQLDAENYSAQTIKAYLGQLNIFFRHIHPKEANSASSE